MRLTPVEFEIMEIVWERGSALVKDVHRELHRRKGLAYTTVMTEMTLMSRKGILSHGRQGRAYLYTPLVSRKQVLEGVLEGMITEFFHGSREELLRFAGGGSAAPLPPPRQKRARPVLPPEAGSRAKPQRREAAAGHVPPDAGPVSAATAAEEEDVVLL